MGNLEPRPVEGTITCALCRGMIPIRFRREPGTEGHLLRIVDHAPLREHLQACASGQREPKLPQIASAGKRACTMCGTTNAACMETLSGPGEQSACCPSCGVGNTHPAPGEDMPCAVWAAEKAGR